MNKQRIEESPKRMNDPRREVMKEPEEVAAMGEAGALKPAAGVRPFRAARDLIRTVQSDCSVEVDANAYSKSR
jgi:hypothetical protein